VDDATKTVERYFDTWNETDAQKRLALAEATWTADARYVDPVADVAGPAAFGDMVGSVQRQFPNHTFRLASAIEQHHDQVRFAWEGVGPDGDVVLAGMDVGRVGEDGRLDAMTGFFGLIPPGPPGTEGA
jgi:hypothetical protein